MYTSVCNFFALGTVRRLGLLAPPDRPLVWLALVLHDCSSAANSDQARPNVSLPDTGAVGVLPLFTPSADSRIWASQVVLLMLLNGRGPFLT